MNIDSKIDGRAATNGSVQTRRRKKDHKFAGERDANQYHTRHGASANRLRITRFLPLVISNTVNDFATSGTRFGAAA